MDKLEELDRYIDSHSEPEEQLLLELERETYLRAINPRMISGHIQGRIMEMMVRMIKPRNILEIGTFTGYSALCMARGLQDGAWIDTFEVDDELEMFSQSFFDRSLHKDKIRLHIGSALTEAPKLGECYDLVFIDGDKREYPDYYRMLFEHSMVHSGSFIWADNILWYGKVARPLEKHDKHTQAICEFNDMVLHDSRVRNVILPIRDGINLIEIK